MADKHQRNTDLVNETNEFSLHHYPEAVDRVEAPRFYFGVTS